MGQSSVLVPLISALICRPCLGRSECCRISYAWAFSHPFGCLALKNVSGAWNLQILDLRGGCRFWGVAAALPGMRAVTLSPVPVSPAGASPAMRSGFSHPPANSKLHGIFSCFFSFSPTNMCFQYLSEPDGWRPLLLSPARILLALARGAVLCAPVSQPTPWLTCPLLPHDGDKPRNE